METTEHLDRWVTWMRAQSWSKKTIEERRSFILRVARDCGTTPTELTADDVAEFLAGQSFGQSTRRNYWLWLRSWFQWLVARGVRADNPTDEIPKPKVGRRALRTITTAHLEMLLSSTIGDRTRTMILLGAYQGLRASEIARVRGSDVDLVSGHLEVRGKGDVHAYVPLHPLVVAEAAKYGQSWWFPGTDGGHVHGESVTDVVGDAMKRARVPGTCHSLRHWYGTELLHQGVDLRTIQQLMRHASLATTEQYLHVDDTQRQAGVLLLPGGSSSPSPIAIPTAVELDAEPTVPAPAFVTAHGPGCLKVCPGHALITSLSTEVSLVAFDGPSHDAPVAQLTQDGGGSVTLTYDQLARVVEAAKGWHRYGEGAPRGWQP